MRKLLLLLLITTSFPLALTQAQTLETREIFPPDTTALDDLYFLKEELADKQMVLLGEHTHMYGNIFEMKSRLVEFLHQELGFTTFAIESPMYDIWKMNQQGFTAEGFNNALFGVWSGTNEFQRVVNYIQENDLKVIGFDSQVMETDKFIEDFFDYLNRKSISIQLDEDDLAIVMEGVLEFYMVDEDDIDYADYKKEIERIIAQIEAAETDQTDRHWKQFIKNLLINSEDAYEDEEILTTDFADRTFNRRDAQMAENLLGYVAEHPTEKIMVWADNLHVMNDNSSITKPIINEFKSMGNWIKDSLGEQVYSLATIHANDSIYDAPVRKWEATPIEENSFEHELKEMGKPYLFISSNQEAMRTAKNTRLLNFIDFTSVSLDQLHDGYLFFSEATLPGKGKVSTNFSTTKNQPTGEKKPPTEKTPKEIVQGKIIDAETKEPISFAYLIIRKNEFYRVADEEGEFEFELPSNIQDDDSLEISSTGFEPKFIKINQIASPISLKPKYESLDEVVIKAYASPKDVLKKVVRGSHRKENYTAEPYNAMRYTKALFSEADTTLANLELITTDYDSGYRSNYTTTSRVEEIKWNKNNVPGFYRFTTDIFEFRENALRYSNILHKRKYKKFDLSYIKSENPEDGDYYIIAFKTDRDKWNFTNRPYPTEYSGVIYINKEDYALVKVIENWQTKLDRDDLQKLYKDRSKEELSSQSIRKEESINYYTKLPEDGKYYVTRVFNRFYIEVTNNEGETRQFVKEKDSYFYDFELEDVEEIPYEFEEKHKKLTRLDRVEYDPTFWKSFYKRGIGGKKPE